MIIDGGGCEIGLESTIVKIENGSELTLLRPGEITVEELSEFTDKLTVSSAVTQKLGEGERVQSPGMKYRHYAPKSPLTLLVGDLDSAIAYVKTKKHPSLGIICYLEDEIKVKSEFQSADVYVIGSALDAHAQARNLFSVLRLCDKKSYDMIYAPAPGSSGLGLALYNRMIRAAAYQIIKL